MSARIAVPNKRNGKKTQVAHYYKVAENKDLFEETLNTINELMELIKKCHANAKQKMLNLVKDLLKLREKMKSQVLIDEIKVNNPIKLLACIRDLKKAGVIEYEPMGMARILVRSCVFVNKFTVNRDQISRDVK